mmetsp:Transcript_9281/g.20646  ORF Transcript_9281/g.20646 Transcript_9281/m.20646 type:complete len:329 (-) Transcript_9281:548-1534(-)
MPSRATAPKRNGCMRLTISPPPLSVMATPCTTTIATMRLTKRASKRTRCLRPNMRLLPMSAPAFSLLSWKLQALPCLMRSEMPRTKPGLSTTSSGLPPTLSERSTSKVATSSSLLVKNALTIFERSSPASPPRLMVRPQSSSTSCTRSPWRLHRMLPGCRSPCTKRYLKTIAQKLSTKVLQASSCRLRSPLSNNVESGSPSSKPITSASWETNASKTSGMATLPPMSLKCLRRVRRFSASMVRSVWASKKAANCRRASETPRWSRPRRSKIAAKKARSPRSMSTDQRTCGWTTFTATRRAGTASLPCFRGRSQGKQEGSGLALRSGSR